MTPNTKNENKPEFSKAITSDVVDSLQDPVEIPQPFITSAFDPQCLLAMERLVREVVHKNQELENVNLQLHACIFELKTNQDQVQQDAIVVTQRIVAEK